MISLTTPIKDLNRVGQSTAGKLMKLGIKTASDLLFYFPWRYDNFGEPTTISQIKPDTVINFTCQIDLIRGQKSRFKRISITEALLSDETGSIKAIWFNQPFISKTLKIGDQISIAGKASFNNGQLILNSPNYEKINNSDHLLHTQGLTPIYSSTANLTQKQLRFLINQVLIIKNKVSDWLPNDIKERLKLLDISDSLEKIHFPKNEIDIREAKKRLGFGELFLRQLRSQLIKKQLSQEKSPSVIFHEIETKKLVNSLAFQLTNDQKKAAWEIIQDLENTQPMSRLLQGDVGSGKTLVAILALFNVALDKQTGVLIAPTEILANQHFASLTQILKDFDIKVGLITRTIKKCNFSNEKTTAPEIINNSQILIGTHALFQEKINLPQLSLIIIDEQHRFGVEQRKKLLEKKQSQKLTPHFLSMTATPIPRSLALAIYGDLKISTIKEKPLNRQPIITKLVTEKERHKAYQFIAQQIQNGRQAFVICPLIDESDKLGVKSVKAEHERLDKEIFPDIKVGLLHGKLKSKEKEEVMQKFLNNETQILVATSVIEVGVDVPNATMMIIEGADRFGLAQLHQFRGRVGRDKYQSYCFLFPNQENISARNPLSRLESLVKHQDGFELAKEDLKLRGSGEIYGNIQSGFPEIKIASLFDFELIQKAEIEAQNLVTQDPNLKNHPLIQEKLGQWERNVHLE